MGCSSREYYIGHPVDDEYKFEETMDDILADDDPERLHHYLKVFRDNYHYPAFLDMCLDRRGSKCALHIIEGKLPHKHPSLRADHIEPKPDVPVLYQLIRFMCEPNVFELVLGPCKGANQVNQLYVGLLPLHWLLDRLTELPPFSEGSLDQPLSKLIASLFLPEVRPLLECACKLAEHTRPLDQVALGYILNGEIIPLAALLLVAPSLTEVVWKFKTLKSYKSIKDIASLAINGHPISRATCSAAALLYLFEKDGDKLTSEFKNPQEGSAQEVQSILTRPPIPIENLVFPRSRFSKSSKMADIITKDEMICRENADKADAKLSFDRYLLFLRSLVEKAEYHNISESLELNSCYISKVLVHIRGGLPALISPISNFFINNKDFPIIGRMCLLHVVLSSLGKYECLSKWSPGESLVKLVLLLFLQSELKPILQCARLLVNRNHLLHELAWHLVEVGEPIQLAGLLLLEPKLAVRPSILDDTIRKAFVYKVCCDEFIAATVSAAGLCGLFVRAGAELAQYYGLTRQYKHEPVEVIVKVAQIIKRSGIQLLSTDVDLTDIDSTSSSHPKMLKSICETLGIEIGKTSRLSQTSRKSPFPSAESVRQECRLEVPIYLEHEDDPATEIQPSGIQVVSKGVESMDLCTTSGHPETLKSKNEKHGSEIKESSGLAESSRKSPFTF